jgi:TPR repeat protein
MRKVILAAILAGFITTAHAGFDEGVTAYNEKNYVLAIKEFRPLAEQGDAKAQFNLGHMYASGQGVPQDDAQAVNWFRKAAEQGNPYAQTNLGAMYQKGQGVKKDYGQAVSWYRKAAEQGNVLAQYNLGWMYAKGEGVKQDYNHAVSWYLKAAEQGETDAQYNLGLLYLDGKGVPQDMVVAYSLFNLAAVGTGANRASAIKNRDFSMSKMTPKQLEAGQRLSREMAKPNHLNKAISEYQKQ